ncbi:two-component system sporulation sensor kinase B [Bacillus ectoiniformans]|uniref:sensor histidine kinase n=1 Tax=Bacillus ectoiniformans TaxID=1494429 RepID=UPI00195EFEDD|nr:HAMP domain-containing sensor histidine kinase [Bacillus ectoiniformans]MBM7648196.1 two-component system sporulation sensor kinase B [Bacillus ectoiniformans]
MKELNNHINKKLYYMTVSFVVFVMMMGLFVDNPRLGHLETGYIVHHILVIGLSACLLLYPKYETQMSRIMIISLSYVYFYTLFFLYPETWSTFIFLCFIPAISILFFDSKLFYYSLIVNNLSIIFTVSYIMLLDKGNVYSYLKLDLIGNAINYLGTQFLIFLIFYLTDVHIKKQKLYYEEIKHTERLKATGQLAAAVAHEIRNPLTVVKGFLQLYEKDPSFNQDHKRHFTLMIDELNTAEQVVSQFLSIAKPNDGTKTESVNVKLVLQSVTDLLYSYGLLRDNKIELDIVEDCYIIANNMELKQLFINIIKNAIEASKSGDSVLVKAGKKNGFAEIKVIDHGNGMSEAEIESLGTPFYSLKSKGTGLGMMICYNIAAKYKGTIEFQSSKGKGTTVIIRFPTK